MPLTHMVPDGVQKSADAALRLHRDPAHKLEDVHGLAVADALATGHVTLDVVQKIDRFFAVNNKPYVEEMQALRTIHDSATIRSWEMHGSDAGRAWAHRVVREAAEAGLIEADPIVELLKLPPEGVYDRFSVGAWRYEYNMDPKKAARFVEEYTRATGQQLELTRAFGAAAPAVGNAIYRRYNTPNPFKELFKSLMVDDPEYREAVESELDYLRTIMTREDARLEESIARAVFYSMAPPTAAKILWPPFVAYLILTVEAPAILQDEIQGVFEKYKPPAPDETPKTFQQYGDTVNTYITYFHPTGTRYVDPSADKDAAYLPDEMYEILRRAFYGKLVTTKMLREALFTAAYWLKKNKLSGPFFNLLVMDWRKKNWKGILDRIPEDADVRDAFARFAKLNPLPKGGVSLQQSDPTKGTLKTVAGYYNVPTDKVQTVPLSHTETGVQALKANTPIGVKSTFEMGGQQYEITGGFSTDQMAVDGIQPDIVFRNLKTGEHKMLSDALFQQAIKKGDVKILQAHKDLPGTKYVEPTTPPEQPTTKEPAATEDGIAAMLKDDFGENYNLLTKMKLEDTITSSAMEDAYGIELHAGETLIDKEDHKFKFVAAYDTSEGAVLVMVGPNNDLMWMEDAEAAEIVEKGTVKFASLAGNEAPKPSFPDPLAASLKPEPAYVPKHAVSEVITLSGLRYHILAYANKNYLLHRLTVSAPTHSSVEVLSASYVDGAAKASGSLVTEPSTLLAFVADYIPSDLSAVSMTIPGYTWGDVVLAGEDVYRVYGLYQTPSKEQQVLASIATVTDFEGLTVPYDDWVLRPPSLFTAVESSYKPTAPKPEPGAIDALDMAGPEGGGSPEMCGTQAAIDWLLAHGLTPAVQSESPLFKFDLGQKLNYAMGKLRIIVGYAFSNTKVPSYVILTELGNINAKEASNGNAQYGPKIEILQSVVNALKPKPEHAEKPGFPRLNYALSAEAKTWAKTTKAIFIQSPPNPIYFVGSKLFDYSANQSYTLIGWVQGPKAVLKKPGSTHALMVSNDELQAYTLNYKNQSTLATGGAITFGKGAHAVKYAVTIHNINKVTVKVEDVSIPSDPPAGWDDPDSISQPPVTQFPAGGAHLSAGIVAVVPPGGSVMAGDKSVHMSHTCVVMVHPMNEYAGYKLTYPKGTIDKGESIEHAAVREVYEETGLSVKPVAYLGDYKGQTSVTRMFIGYVTGGDPQKAGNETDAVAFKPLTDWLASWGGLVTDRDKKITTDALEWMGKHGTPDEYVPKQAAAPSSATGPQDVEGQTGPKAFDPNLVDSPPQAGSANKPQPIDYYVDAATINFVEAQEVFNGTTWRFVKQSGYVEKGYPPVGGQSKPVVGTKIRYKKTGTVVYEMKGYVRAEAGSAQWERMIVQAVVFAPAAYHSWDLTMSGTGSNDVVLVGIGPDQFEPVDEPVLPKTKTIPGKTPLQDLLTEFAYTSPFPVNQSILNELKNLLNVTDAVPISIKGTTLPPSITMPLVGAVFTYQTVVGYSTMLGYITVETEEEVFTFAVVAKPNEYVGVWSANPSDLHKYKVLPGTAKIPAHWAYQHADPSVHSMIVHLSVVGEAPSVTLPKFKKWMKEAGVPNSHLLKKTDIQKFAGLFVGGKYTQVEQTVLIESLALKAKSKAKVAKVGKADVVADAPTVLPVDDYQSLAVKKIIAHPSSKQFTQSEQQVSGGSNPSAVLLSHGGAHKWFFKMAKDENITRAYTEAAAYDFMAAVEKDDAVPVGVLFFNGKLGSLQPLLDISPVPSDPSVLSDDDKARVLEQHMIDMFMGDHDGFPANWGKLKDGRLVAVDRGQAFKFVLLGTAESLDPYWNAPGNMNAGSVYGKKLLRDWIEEKSDLPASAWKAARVMISRIQQISDEVMSTILTPVFESMKLDEAGRKKVLTKLAKKRDAYLDDWTEVLTKYNKDFKWPTVGAVTLSVAVKMADHDPAAIGYGKVEQKEIQEASKHPHTGTTIRVDRDLLENQEVFVRRVLWQREGKDIPATLINFRLAYHTGTAYLPKTLKMVGDNIHGAVTKFEASGAAKYEADGVLQVDKLGQYWVKIHKAIRNFVYHACDMAHGGTQSAAEENPTLNKDTQQAAQDLIPELHKLLQQTKEEGTYKPTGEPNSAVRQMAGVYLQYVEDVLKPRFENPKEYINKKINLSPYIYIPPKKDEKKKTEEAPVWAGVLTTKPKVHNQNARVPDVKLTQKGTIVTNLDKLVLKTTQSYIELKGHNGAEVVVFPVGSFSGVGHSYKGYQGLSWGIVEGEPSTATVSYLLHMIETVTGMTLPPATDHDLETLYWIKQAYLVQQYEVKGETITGIVHPGSMEPGVGIATKELQQLVKKYRGGDQSPKLVEELQEFVSTRVNVPVATLQKRAAKAVAGFSTAPTGGGIVVTDRVDLTRDELEKRMGKWHVAHALFNFSSMSGFLLKAVPEPILYAQNMRMVYGISKIGASEVQDVDYGGSPSLFAVLRHIPGPSQSNSQPVFYFDPSLLMRNDVFITASDNFGDPDVPRYVHPDAWLSLHHTPSGHIYSGAHPQVVIRHSTDLRKYVIRAQCVSATDAKECIKICKEKGWTFANGLEPSQVFFPL